MEKEKRIDLLCEALKELESQKSGVFWYPQAAFIFCLVGPDIGQVLIESSCPAPPSGKFDGREYA